LGALVALVTLASPVAAAFIRGDVNQDGRVDISDPRRTLDFLFVGAEEPECPAAADANDDERIDISDAIFVLDFLFLGGPPPRPPYPQPGQDPTPGLGCGFGPPTDLRCVADGPSVVLTWVVGGSYDVIEVSRDGDEIAELAGDASAYHDFPPLGGDHAYSIVGKVGRDRTDAVTCTVRRLPTDTAPSLVLLSPAQGAVFGGSQFRLTGRVDDDTGLARLVVDGADVAVPAGVALPYTFRVDVSRPDSGPGPFLVRVEAVDDAGHATFRELAVGFGPLLRTGAETDALALDISGGSGYDEIEAIIEPFLDEVPTMLNDAVRGVRLYNGTIAGVDITVTGQRVQVMGEIVLLLEPSIENGGRLVLRVVIPHIRFSGVGRSDFGFLGTDTWDAVWIGNNVRITGAIAFVPTNGGRDLRVISDGFNVDIASSDFSVSGFLDPFGIFDAVVNSLSGLFEDQIEASVQTAVEDAANEQIVPILEDALSGLKLDLDLGFVSLQTLFDDVVESATGLSLLFDGAWDGDDPHPGYPRYPGTKASFAPFPRFPIPASPGHPVDATISLSADSLNQALGVMTATGQLVSDFALDDIEAPIPLNVGTIAAVFDQRFLTLPGVDATDPLAVHIEARYPPDVRLGVGTPGVAIVPVGAEWRWLDGAEEPPSSWKLRGFSDFSWERAPSGFGYSSDPAEMRNVSTEIDAMADGHYTSIYLRRSFVLDDVDALRGLALRITYDDAFVAYLNGTEVGRRNIGTPGSPVSHDAPADGAGEPTLAEIDLLEHRDLLLDGSNVVAIQGHNAAPTSSDFVLVPELVKALPAPPGTLSSMPAQIALDGIELAFVADTDSDGIGADDADGDPDEVELFSYSIGLRLQAELLLVRGDGGVPTLAFVVDTQDGPDPDSFPDAVIGGAAGLDIRVAGESWDVDDGDLVEFAELLLAVFGSSLGETLAGFELPAIPIPELAFDLDEDGQPDVTLDIDDGTFEAVDTNGDGVADWVCVLSNLIAR